MSKSKIDYTVQFNEQHGRWDIVVESACPDCGKDKIFNGKIEETCQYVSYGEDDDGNQVCGPDDTMNAEVTYLSCGHCGNVLID